MSEIGITYYNLGEYMVAFPQEIKGRKTPIYELCNKKDETIHLGEVKWNNAWRKYCWYSEEETVFDSKCLTELIDFLNYLNKKKGE